MKHGLVYREMSFERFPSKELLDGATPVGEQGESQCSLGRCGVWNCHLPLVLLTGTTCFFGLEPWKKTGLSPPEHMAYLSEILHHLTQ